MSAPAWLSGRSGLLSRATALARRPNGASLGVAAVATGLPAWAGGREWRSRGIPAA